jgi:hypothetical protein
MINDDHIAEALARRLRLITPKLMIVWDNAEYPSALQTPFVLFGLVPVSTTDTTLTGGGEIKTGFASIHIMARINTYARESRELAQRIKEVYPYTLRLPIEGGDVTIHKPCEVMQGYPDGPYYRTPITVPYSAS